MQLGGWHRIGILVWLLWALLVTAYGIYELTNGTASRMLLIHMMETGEAARVEQSGSLRVTLVPVQASLIPWRVAAALLLPPVVLLMVVACVRGAVRWVQDGFRQGGA